MKQYKNFEKDDISIKSEKKASFELLRLNFSKALSESGLTGKLGGNNGGYKESEIGKFYFKDNDVELLKEKLLPFVHELLKESGLC